MKFRFAVWPAILEIDHVCYVSEIAFSVVEAIAVDMVGFQSLWGFGYHSVHVDMRASNFRIGISVA